MALRPEALRIGQGGDDRNTLAGVIEDVAFLGAVVRVRVRLAEAAVIIDTFNTGASDLPARGAPITVNFGRDDLIPLLAH
jgi:putative spermidine/putrescine transport system ATP-binding protein